MKNLRLAFIVIAVAALLPIGAQALIQSQRAQIGITIIINATPNPLGYLHQGAATETEGIVARATLRGAPAAVEQAFEAQQLHFLPMSGQVVAQVQHSLRVEAEVTPNPNATLLTTDAAGSTVIVNAEAGIATHFSCVYHVSVQTTITSWSLKHGLATDFSSSSGNTFIGGDVGNNSYITTPLPTATPFAVYATNGGQWALLQSNGGTKTYCVDLTVNMPIATPQGQYSSNAIYTLYY